VTEKNTPDFESAKPGGVSRRTVTKAMAWAVPAIAIAAPVPAFAGASQGILTLDGTGCKLPGNSNATYKGYAFNLNATNTTANIYYCIEIVSVFLGTTNLGGVTVINLATGQDFCTNLGNPFCVGPGENLTELALVTENAANSSNGQLVVTYRVRENVGSCECSGYGPTQVVSTGINDAPPINGASCSVFTKNQKKCMAGETPPPAWMANTAYAEGDQVSVSGSFLVAIVGGTSGGTVPVLPGAGNTVVDGSVTWEQIAT
jgi:hypothetical protein